MKKEKIELKKHDIVEVKKDSTHAMKGEIGTIVNIYKSGSFEVEFLDPETKKHLKIVLLSPDEVKLYKQIKIKENGKTN